MLQGFNIKALHYVGFNKKKKLHYVGFNKKE